MNYCMLLVTGITGLTGRFLYQRLTATFPDVKILYLVRKSSDTHFMKPGESLIHGDLNDPQLWSDQVRGVETVLHLAPRNKLRSVMAVCALHGIRRLYFVSSTGIYSQFKKSSHIDLRNEADLFASDLVHTTIRPTMIYGNAQDGNLHMLAKGLDRWPVYPIIGPGKGLMQPIHADDLAQVIVSALRHEEATRFKAFDVAGIAPIAYKDLLMLLARTMNKPVRFLHVPYRLALLLGKLGSRIRSPLLRYEKVLRLHEDKTFDYSLAASLLDFKPRPHAVGIQEEVEALVASGTIRRRH